MYRQIFRQISRGRRIISTAILLELDFSAMEIFRFDGDLCKWSYFMQNFKNQLHDKHSFTGYIQMERLLSVLDGETKGTVISIDRKSHFYATPMKMLTSNFGNLMVAYF